MIQMLSKPQIVLGLRDKLGGDLRTAPAAAGGKAARVQLIGFRIPQERIPMLRVSSRATDSSEEASVMGAERCGGVVWELKQTNSATRMRL